MTRTPKTEPVAQRCVPNGLTAQASTGWSCAYWAWGSARWAAGLSGGLWSHRVECPSCGPSGLFKMQEMLSRNVRIALGTDGASSNNNLDMHEAMKFASLLAKRENPEILPAEEAFKMASRNGALAYGLDAGVIQEGALADALLVDLNNERLVPNYNLISNWVYAADSRSIVSVICNGRFIMENRKIDGEEEIIESAKETAQRLLNS